MRRSFAADHGDELILLARVLLMVVFVMAGWTKLTGFTGAVAYMGALGLPVPAVTACVVIAIEIAGGIALVLGAYTSPLAILFALYAIATAFIGHRYWTMTGAEHANNLYHFYKDVSIAGGLLALSVAGAGKYSIDRWIAARRGDIA